MQKNKNLTYKTILAAITLLLCFTNTLAQTVNGPLILSSPNTTGNYSSNVRVTLSTGFTTTGPFTATIQPFDCLTLTTAPTLTGNYVISNTPRISGFTDESQLTGLGSCQLMQSIQYADGLGRPIQTVQVMASPFGNDMIQPQAYDQYGREVTKYLPYTPATGTAGSYRLNAVSTEQQAFYTTPPAGVSAIANAYAQTLFDNSPLNRPVEQGATGAAWQPGGHTVKMDYASNNATAFATDSVNGRQVALYTTTISSSGGQTLNRTGNTATYAVGQLTLTIAKDENWTSGRAGTVEEYKDIDGHVILKRTYNYTGGQLQQLSTYYVYDDKGQLAFVLPPGANPDAAAAISTTTLNNYCYQYMYDGLGRMVQKRIPGKGWDYTVYNNMDQPVATQDSLQRLTKQWIYTEYDAQGRVAITGTWINPGTDTRPALQGILTAINSNFYESPAATTSGYTNVAWPTTGTTTPLAINYYDSYSNAPSLPAQYTAPAGADLATRGQLVASKTAVLNTPANMLWSTHYYDYWGRSLTGYAQHYLGGTLNAGNFDALSATYDFTGAATTTTRKHWNTTSATVPLLTITNTYIYDHVGRKLKSWEQIQNGSSTPTTKTLLSKTDYNEIGQVKTKMLHSTDSTTFLQPVNYTYNERGWLQTSSASLFQMQLLYNTGTNKQYNGNIAYQQWGTAAAPNTNTFTYTYDKLNRLTSGTSVSNDNETGIAYDAMGNITTLQRYQAGTLIDNLTYTYSGTNQLQSITDATTSDLGLKHGTWAYTYDGNGNLKTDPTKATTSITIGYNLLNLPQSITGGKTITYTYDAAGNKLRRVSPATGNTDYISGIQYDGTTTPALTFIQTEEGKAVPNGAGYDYQYYLGDNLGNTRVTFGTKTGAVVSYQNDDYLPFGMEINRNVLYPKNEYLYNKKELQEELGELDYGARFYDPVVARWGTIDPLAEISGRGSPYNYVENNPIRFIDPDGMRQETHEEIEADEQRWADEKQGFEEAKNPYASFAGNLQDHGRDATVDAEAKKATELSTEYSVNESGQLVKKTLDIITFVERLASTVVLVFTPEPMADENGPIHTDQQQNASDDQFDLSHFNKSGVQSNQDDFKRKYLTYLKSKTNADGSVTIYSGRTSGGINESDDIILRRRDATHHIEGYGPAVLDKSSTNRLAIRGREQQLIDYFGRAKSDNGTSGNLIRGVDKRNVLGRVYHTAATLRFGGLYKYTGL